MIKGQVFESLFTFNSPSFSEINDMVTLVNQACDCVILDRPTTIERIALKCLEHLTKVIT